MVAHADADTPTVAAFRPDDERIEDAVDRLESLGAKPVPDPMLAIEPTGETPRTDADYVVLTSKTGVELVADTGWEPGDATLVAIGPSTAGVLRDAGYEVDIVPEEYTSSGIVAALADRGIDDARIEIARSDHGSDVLPDGLADAGASVHETVLYRLVRPDGSGQSAELAAAGDLDGLCFTSPLTVEHFLEAATARGLESETRAGLENAVVGVIGDPTAEAAADCGLPVDLVASEATFETLAQETVEAATETGGDR
ncbi:uroporphyrinogen-III synthase [Halobiforma nitratireducens]|uniref:Uroporphyrinogen-III synthase n=1 Tax=Halobiforma nitratireducens JCM 10879 TaxID=1227454 RepID=M0M1D3_9EURY|nr:uroporphyrinogen-III synthase [Halobiforma nitratireducens]EMA38200.1 uroporphyrinogen-III synthase [Halobiforma nitratireducens JCM 10879]